MGQLRMSHGTDLDSATEIRDRGLSAAAAARYNSTGEFWASTDAGTADWFARTNPASGSPARLDFDLSEDVLALLVNQALAVAHGTADFEFLPASFAILNQAMSNKQVVPVP
jgi:hypothetical protein